MSAQDFAPYLCLKPQKAPVNKDNAYGFGLPAMGTMIDSVAGLGRYGVAEMTAGIFGIGLVGMVISMLRGIM